MLFSDCDILNTKEFVENITEVSDSESGEEISDDEYYVSIDKTKKSSKQPAKKTWKPKIGKGKNIKRTEERKVKTIEAIKTTNMKLFLNLIYDYVGKLFEINRVRNIPTQWGFSFPIVKKLLNEVLDDRGNRVLHYCAIYAAGDIAFFAMKEGANPCFRNVEKKTPYACILDEKTKKQFQEFTTYFPNKYNYSKVRIFFFFAISLV